MNLILTLLFLIALVYSIIVFINIFKTILKHYNNPKRITYEIWFISILWAVFYYLN